MYHKNNNKLDAIVAKAHEMAKEREKGYREQALRLYPWVCGRCARDFTRENLRELTVHHRDHDHDNNPSDGSNWELLCLYCHDNEHQREEEAYQQKYVKHKDKGSSDSTYNPFAGLGDLLKKDKD